MSTLTKRKPGLPVAWRWAMVLLWMGFIYVMSAQTSSGEQSMSIVQLIANVIGAHPNAATLGLANHLLRKSAHFVVYGTLAALSYWALPGQGSRRFLGAWAIAALYAGTDEFHQVFVPHRGPSVWDVGLDSCGSATGLIITWLLTRRR